MIKMENKLLKENTVFFTKHEYSIIMPISIVFSFLPIIFYNKNFIQSNYYINVFIDFIITIFPKINEVSHYSKISEGHIFVKFYLSSFFITTIIITIVLLYVYGRIYYYSLKSLNKKNIYINKNIYKNKSLYDINTYIGILMIYFFLILYVYFYFLTPISIEDSSYARFIINVKEGMILFSIVFASFVGQFTALLILETIAHIKKIKMRINHNINRYFKKRQ